MTSRCIAGKVTLLITVRNDETTPATVEVASQWGRKTLTAMAPGSTTSFAQSTRAASIGAGAVTVTTSVDGAQGEQSVPFTARSCS